MTTSSHDAAWNAYIDKFDSEPSASQLLSFSKMKSNNLIGLSFSEARKTFNRNKGKGKVNINADKTNDLSIFNHIKKPKEKCVDFRSCPCVHRLIMSLQYYSSLNVQGNKHEYDIFCNFSQEVYKITSVINDFHHLQEKHGKQIHGIMEFASGEFKCSNCDINTCHFANRHYRIDNTEDTKLSDSNMSVYIDIMDSFHYYIFHLFVTGFRFIDQGKDDEIDDSKDNDHSASYDPEFAKMEEAISSTRAVSDRFDRISSGIKYNINGTNTESEGDESQGITYLDTIFQHLQQINIPNDVISRLYNYLKEHKFDTEAMDMDLEINDGNIKQYMIDDSKCIDAILHHFNQSHRMSTLCFYLLLTNCQD